MNKEQYEAIDKKIAEMIRNDKRATDLGREINENVAKTTKAVEAAAKVKIEPAQFDFTKMNAALENVRRINADVQRRNKVIQAVCDDLASGKLAVEVDTEAIQRSVKAAKEATANANRICENLRQKTGDC